MKYTCFELFQEEMERSREEGWDYKPLALTQELIDELFSEGGYEFDDACSHYHCCPPYEYRDKEFPDDYWFDPDDYEHFIAKMKFCCCTEEEYRGASITLLTDILSKGIDTEGRLFCAEKHGYKVLKWFGRDIIGDDWKFTQKDWTIYFVNRESEEYKNHEQELRDKYERKERAEKLAEEEKEAYRKVIQGWDPESAIRPDERVKFTSHKKLIKYIKSYDMESKRETPLSWVYFLMYYNGRIAPVAFQEEDGVFGEVHCYLYTGDALDEADVHEYVAEEYDYEEDSEEFSETVLDVKNRLMGHRLYDVIRWNGNFLPEKCEILAVMTESECIDWLLRHSLLYGEDREKNITPIEFATGEELCRYIPDSTDEPSYINDYDRMYYVVNWRNTDLVMYFVGNEDGTVAPRAAVLEKSGMSLRKYVKMCYCEDEYKEAMEFESAMCRNGEHYTIMCGFINEESFYHDKVKLLDVINSYECLNRLIDGIEEGKMTLFKKKEQVYYPTKKL